MSSGQPPRASLSSLAIPVWVLLLVSGLFAATCAALWAIVVVTRPTVEPQATPSAVFVVLTPAAPAEPTATLVLVAAPTVEQTPTIPPPQAEGVIQIGALVQVANTGGDPLRLRLEPGLSTDVNYFALEFEVLQVQDGPREANGFVWWYLVAQADATKNGWGAENWLQVVRNP